MKCLGPIELPKHTLQCVTLCIKTIRTPFDVIANAVAFTQSKWKSKASCLFTQKFTRLTRALLF